MWCCGLERRRDTAKDEGGNGDRAGEGGERLFLFTPSLRGQPAVLLIADQRVADMHHVHLGVLAASLPRRDAAAESADVSKKQGLFPLMHMENSKFGMHEQTDRSWLGTSR